MINWIKNHPITSIWLLGPAIIIGYFIFQNYFENKKVETALLVAVREAPIGGGYIHLYKNNEIEHGAYVIKKSMRGKGKYVFRNDTIYLESDDAIKYFNANYFLIKGNSLSNENMKLFIKGQRYYSITKNILK